MAKLYLCKIISTFYHNYLKKPAAILLLIDSILQIVKPIIKLNVKFRAETLSIKQKQGSPKKVNSNNKYIKKT